MKKRLLSMFLCLCMAFTLMEITAPTAEAATALKTKKPSVMVATPAGVSGKWKTTGSSAAAELTWNAVKNADHYEVGYKKNGGNWETLPYCILTPITSQVFEDLDSSSSYSLRVRAVKSDIPSAWAECELASSAGEKKLNGSYKIPSVYIQQADDGCYIASAAMVISNYRLLNGGSAVTYDDVKAANGNDTYLRNWKKLFNTYDLVDVDLWTSANSGLSGSAKEEIVSKELPKNNYGAMLCFKKGKDESHAVVIVGYDENGNIIVNDPARYDGGGEGIKLTDCKWIRNNITGPVSQEHMLAYSNSLTYFVATGSTNPTTPGSPKLANPAGVSGFWTSTGPNWAARISWNAVSGATSYEVQYRTPKTGNAWRADPDYSSGTSYVSTGLKDYNSYDYRVRARNSSGFSDWTEYTLIKPISTPEPTPTPPSAPTGVSGSWTSTGPNWTAKISWNAVSGATRYEVQYRTPKTGNAWKADPDYSSGTSYISTGLKDYNSYDYRVRACNSSGASSWISYTLDKPEAATTPTTPVLPSAPPSVPGGVSGFWTSAGSKWQARVSWSAVNGAEHYEVQYKKVNGNNWSSTITVKSETSHTFSGLGTDASYDFRVKAVNARGSSGWVECSLPAREQIVSDLGGKQQDSIAAPAGISGTWTSRGPNWTAKISWNAVSGATSYEVQYRTPKTGNAWKADPDYSSGTSYISTGLKDYNSYDYRVRAVNASGPSDWTEYKLEKNVVPTPPTLPGSSQNPSVYIQQADSDGCYVAAAAMIISNYRLLNGGSAVTYAEVKTANGNSTYFDWGTFGKFGLKDVDLWTSANSGLSGSARAQRVLIALGKNDYGAMLCFKGKGKSHAVVITGYENGSIIVNDPARSDGGERIKLTDCKWIRDNITGYVSQEQMLTYANSLTYFVATGSTNPSTPVSPKLANPAGVSGFWTSTGPNWAARISWNAVSGATSYEVQYRTPKTGNAWKADLDYSSGTSYVSTGLKDYNSYDYRVRARNSSGASDWTTYTLVKPTSTPELAPSPVTPAPTPTPPSAPSGVSSSWTSTGPTWQARISWNAVSGATSYEVQYRTPKTGSAWRADPDYSSGTSYVSTGLKDYNSYDYRVRACNSAGASAWTTYTLVKPISTPETTPVQTTPTPAPTVPTPTPPGTPSGVSGSWTSMGPTWQARISWNAVSGATYYEVQYRTPKTGNAWRADPDYSSGTSYISTGLLDYNSYDYRVRACNSSGASAWTTYTLTKPIPAVPAAPTGVSGSWTSMGPTWQARISWNAVSGATYYEVQYRTPKTGNAWRADPDYSSGTSYISTGLKDYNSYDYRVRAVNANGASDWTEYTLYK